MQARQIVTSLRQVFTTAEKLGATIPKAIRAEHDKLSALAERTRHGLDLRADLSDAVLEALAADRDPVTDDRVRSAVVAQVIAGTSVGIETALNERVVGFLHSHAEAILQAFAKPFNTAAAAVTEAAAALGPVDLDDTRAVLRRGEDAARLWTKAQEAESVIKRIRDTYALLGAAHSAYKVDPRYQLLAYADVPPAAFVDDQLGRVSLTAWQVAQRGFALSLATPTEVRRRIAAVRAEIEARNTGRADAFRDGYRRTHGTGVPAA